VRYKLVNRSRRQQWKRTPGSYCVALLLVLLFAASPVRAEAAPRQLSVLRAGDAALDDPQTIAVDAALHDALTARLGSTVVQASSAPLEDVQLIAGCGDDEAACLQSIAMQLGSDALLVRRLSAQPDGSVLLSLTAFGTHAEQTAPQTRQLSTNVEWNNAQSLERGLLLLLTELQVVPPEPLPEPEVVMPVQAPDLAAPPPASVERVSGERSRWPMRLGWTLSAVGCGLLGAGLMSGALSRRDERRYARVTIDGMEAADEALSHLSSARQHAHVANGLFIGGAVITVAGLTTTFWQWASVRSDRGSATLSVQSTRSGLMLVVNGSWRGGS
jgi:hypothetical protein